MRQLWLLACLGCGSPVEPSRRTVVELRATPFTAVDLLLVIDDSNNTAHLQTSLGAAMPTLLERIGPTSLHLGVVTSDLGTRSSTGEIAPDVGTVGAGGCSGSGRGGAMTVAGAPVDGAFLRQDADDRNYDGDLADAIMQMVRVGSSGCGFEQPLAAMRAALDDNPANAGFLRPEALLGVIVLADEDDCSSRDPALFGPDTPEDPQSFRCTRSGVTCTSGGATPGEMTTVGLKEGCGPNTTDASLLDDPRVFRDFLVDLKGDPRAVVVGGIFGEPSPVEIVEQLVGQTLQPTLVHSCTFESPLGVVQGAAPGVRLEAFGALFGERAASTSICQSDLTSPLEAIGRRIAFAMGSACLLQPASTTDCIVEDLVGDLTTPIPSCPDGPTCWTIQESEVCGGLELVITRATPADPTTITRARCAVE